MWLSRCSIRQMLLLSCWSWNVSRSWGFVPSKGESSYYWKTNRKPVDWAEPYNFYFILSSTAGSSHLTCSRYQTSSEGCTAGWCRFQTEHNLQPVGQNDIQLRFYKGTIQPQHRVESLKPSPDCQVCTCRELKFMSQRCLSHWGSSGSLLLPSNLFFITDQLRCV